MSAFPGRLRVVASGPSWAEALAGADLDLGAESGLEPSDLQARWARADSGQASLGSWGPCQLALALDARGRVVGAAAFTPRGPEGKAQVLHLTSAPDAGPRVEWALLRQAENWLRIRGHAGALGWPRARDEREREVFERLGWDPASPADPGQVSFRPRGFDREGARFLALRGLLAGAFVFVLATWINGSRLGLALGLGAALLNLLPAAIHLRAHLRSRERPLLAVAGASAASLGFGLAAVLWGLSLQLQGLQPNWIDRLLALGAHLGGGLPASLFAEGLCVGLPIAFLVGLPASQSVLDLLGGSARLKYLGLATLAAWATTAPACLFAHRFALAPNLASLALLGFLSALSGLFLVHGLKWVPLRERGFPFVARADAPA